MAALLSSSGSSHHNLLTSPQSLSPQSTAALVLGLLHNPETPAPSSCTFQGTSVHVWGMYVCGKDCLILIPFSLPRISCFTLSLKSFSSDSDSCPDMELGPLLQLPHPLRAGPVLLTLRSLPLVPSSTEFCVSLYILFQWSGTPVCSRLVFCMHFGVRGCIPDESVEKVVFHIHLLLRYLILLIHILLNHPFVYLSSKHSISLNHCFPARMQ